MTTVDRLKRRVACFISPHLGVICEQNDGWVERCLYFLVHCRWVFPPADQSALDAALGLLMLRENVVEENGMYSMRHSQKESPFIRVVYSSDTSNKSRH